jgi:hypothetical protein
MVPPESPVRRPEDLAGVPVGVGYHSGSHFTTLQALEAVLAPDQISLSFQGPPNERLDALLERQVPAATMFGVPLYIAEAFGFRKVLDATFMIGFLVSGTGVSKADIEKYLAALRQAQMEIDLHPETYQHYHLRAVPEKYRDQVDVRAFGTGERIVFLPYTGRSSARPSSGRGAGTCSPRSLRPWPATTKRSGLNKLPGLAALSPRWCPPPAGPGTQGQPGEGEQEQDHEPAVEGEEAAHTAGSAANHAGGPRRLSRW